MNEYRLFREGQPSQYERVDLYFTYKGLSIDYGIKLRDVTLTNKKVKGRFFEFKCIINGVWKKLISEKLDDKLKFDLDFNKNSLIQQLILLGKQLLVIDAKLAQLITNNLDNWIPVMVYKNQNKQHAPFKKMIIENTTIKFIVQGRELFFDSKCYEQASQDEIQQALKQENIQINDWTIASYPQFIQGLIK